LTLRTHPLPEFFGGVFATIKATSDDAFHRLISQIVRFYAEQLHNRHWGEQIVLRPDNILAIAMVFQGLDQQEAEAIWDPFFAWVAGFPDDYRMESSPTVLAAPARLFWDPASLRQIPGLVLADDRPGAPESNVFWSNNLEEAGQVLHAYQSTWLPVSLLGEDEQQTLNDALYAATRHSGVSLHINKGLAGAPTEAIEAARDTAINPAALDAFALLISAAEGPPAYLGVSGREPDVSTARSEAAAIDRSMREIRNRLPNAGGSYVAESDFFDQDWQRSYWGANYGRLLAIKDEYDPDGLFFVHHGAGSERWSEDGFTLLS
jgi:FAD/FMN-containing dehydrogenase